MNKKNEELSTAQFKNVPTRMAEIVLRFEVPKAEATDNWINAVVGVIKREVAADLGKSAEVTGKWL
jgi:hypothetical protein